MRFWGFIEAKTERAGWWRISEKGKLFVEGKISVPRHVLIYNQVCIGFDEGDKTDIFSALNDKFSYQELMRE